MMEKPDKLIVGVRQTWKTLQRGEAETVYIALDAEPEITSPIREMCNDNGIRVKDFNTMGELGKYCGIDIGASVACQKKQDNTAVRFVNK
jgi:large subunit ribosomal protein L7A